MRGRSAGGQIVQRFDPVADGKCGFGLEAQLGLGIVGTPDIAGEAVAYWEQALGWAAMSPA